MKFLFYQLKDIWRINIMVTIKQIQTLKKALKGQTFMGTARCNICEEIETFTVEIDKNKAICNRCSNSMDIPNEIWKTPIEQFRKIGVQI